MAVGVEEARWSRYCAVGFAAFGLGTGGNWLAVGDAGGGNASAGNGDCRAEAGVPGDGMDRCCC